MIKIYKLPFSRAIRIEWLLEEMGVPYETKEYDRNANFSSKDDYKQEVHILGKAPVVEDGDIKLFESGAIMQYLLEKYGKDKLVPAVSSQDYPRYLEWMYATEGDLMPALMLPTTLKSAGVGDDSPAMKAALGSRDKLLAYIESELGSRPYIGGQEFSAADIMLIYFFVIADFLKIDFSTFPNMTKYRALITARPAYRKVSAQ